MKLIPTVTLLTAALLAAPAADLNGTWKVQYSGPKDHAPKTIGSMVFDLKMDGNVVTGTAHIGVWPGDAPIADGKVEGDRITFTATGRLGSSTGIPTCQFVAIVHGDDMSVTMTATRNAGGPLGANTAYEYKGQKELR